MKLRLMLVVMKMGLMLVVILLKMGLMLLVLCLMLLRLQTRARPKGRLPRLPPSAKF
jgi:hypothetical protein